MKKSKIILGVLVVVIIVCILGLIGYRRDDGTNVDTSNNSYENVEDILGGANIDKNEIETSVSGETSGDGNVNIGLYSNENRAVFNFENIYYLVYEFNGEDVVGLSYYYAFENESTAQVAAEHFRTSLKNNELENSENINEIANEGKYVIIELKESMYDETTKQQVMETYSYLEQIYSKSGE